MKQHSVKLKLTLWLTLLMTALAGLLLVFMLLIGNVVASQTAMSQLSQTLQANLGQIGMTDGKLNFGDAFSFFTVTFENSCLSYDSIFQNIKVFKEVERLENHTESFTIGSEVVTFFKDIVSMIEDFTT